MFMTQEQKEKYIASLYFSVKKDEVKKEDTFLHNFYPGTSDNTVDTIPEKDITKGDDDGIG